MTRAGKIAEPKKQNKKCVVLPKWEKGKKTWDLHFTFNLHTWTYTWTHTRTHTHTNTHTHEHTHTHIPPYTTYLNSETVRKTCYIV